MQGHRSPTSWNGHVPSPEGSNNDGYVGASGEASSGTTEGKGGKIANIKKKLDLGAPTQKLHLGPSFDRSLFEMLTECHCGNTVTEQEIKQMMSEAKCPVVLNVYTVGHSKVLQEINYVVENFLGEGGVFHGAIEVLGHEHSFGGCRQNRCGIFTCKPKVCPMHTYRESFYLGDCNKTERQVHDILESMKPEWMGPTYDLLRKNCCYFSEAFSLKLGTGKIPKWVNHLAHVGAILDTESKSVIHELHSIEDAIDGEANEVWEFTHGKSAKGDPAK